MNGKAVVMHTMPRWRASATKRLVRINTLFPRPLGLLTTYTQLRMEYGVLRWIREGLRLDVSNGLKLEFFVEHELSGDEPGSEQQARHGVGITGVMKF